MRSLTSDGGRPPGMVDQQERERRRRERLCMKCGGPILGRDSRASTCLLHREYGGPPSASELRALIAEYTALIQSLRGALAEMGEEVEPR